VPEEVVPTVYSFCPMGFIHLFDAFLYGNFRRVKTFTIALPLDPHKMKMGTATIIVDQAEKVG